MQIKAYKTEIYPNNKQATQLKQMIGSSRFVYNNCLAHCIETYEEEKKYLSAYSLNLFLTKLKIENKWLYDTPNRTLQLFIIYLERAFKNFFSNVKKKKSGKKGFPKFKKKSDSKQTVHFHTLPKQNKEKYFRLTNKLYVRLSENNYLPLHLKIKQATVSYKAGRWFVSICVEHEIEYKNSTIDVLGVDLGIKTYATCSDGSIYENQKVTNQYAKKLARENRKFSRKQKGSKNRHKQKLKLQKIHYKISNKRKDSINKMTTSIVSKAKTIIIEDLNVSGMVKNNKLAKSVSDASFYEIRRQLEYKAKWYGKEIVIVDRFFPSSKTCSCCGVIKEKLSLDERVFSCDDCGFEMERDLNAAINLKQYYTAGLAGIDAFGDRSSLDSTTRLCQDSLSLKKESSNKGDFI